jgi:hypothetical protein
MGRPRKTTVIIEPESGDEDRERERPARAPATRDNTVTAIPDLSELQDVCIAAEDAGAVLRLGLYREDRSGTQYAHFYLSDLPRCPTTYSEVGEVHGGGRYKIFARWKVPGATSWKVFTHGFALAPRFDAIARANASRAIDDNGLPVAAAPVPVAPPVVVRTQPIEPTRDRMTDMLDMVKAIVSVVAPLIKPQRDPLEMIQVIAGMGQTMFKSQLDHAEDYSRRIMDMADARVGIEQEPAPVEEPTPKDPVMAMMLEALKTVVPMFRSSPEATARQVAAPLTQRPDVKALIGDIKRRRRMMVELRKEFDEQEVARLCRIFNVPYSPVPAQQPGATAESPAAEPVRFVRQDLFVPTVTEQPDDQAADPDAGNTAGE